MTLPQGLYLFTGAYNSACYNSTLGLLEQGFDDPDLFGCGPWRQCPSGYQCTVGMEGSKHVDARLLGVGDEQEQNVHTLSMLIGCGL